MFRFLFVISLFCTIAAAQDSPTRSRDGRLDYSYPRNQTILAGNHVFFVSTFQRWAKLGDKSKSENVAHQRYSGTAASVGMSYSRNAWEIGAALSFEHAKRKYDTVHIFLRNRDIQRSVNTAGLTLFGTYNLPKGWYGSGSLFAGYTSTNNNLRRWNRPGNMFRDDSGQFGLSVESGKHFALENGVVITPHIGIDASLSTSEYIASESAQASWHGKPQYSFIVPIGLKLTKEFCFGDKWTVAPHINAEFLVSLRNKNSYIFRPGVASYDGKGWKVFGAGIDSGGGNARISAGSGFRYRDRVTLDLEYTFERHHQYSDHRIAASFGLAF